MDPAYDMPAVNWGQQGSFLQPTAVPSAGPLDGTQIQLPCVNEDWLLLIMGALDQLRNPSAWDASGSTLETALSWVTDLQELVWSAMGSACVNPVINVAIDCVNGLQYQTADMVWHVGTSMADICECTTACIISPTPPNPASVSTAQEACNIAGFLAQEITQKTMAAVVAYVGTTDEQVHFAHDLLSSLAFAFPITAAFANAAFDFYQLAVGQVLAVVEGVRDDPLFWSEITCAIYLAIKVDGKVTAANYPVASANIAAITYPQTWAVSAVHQFWDALGLNNIQALQNVGALDDVDCTTCTGAYCWLDEFTTGTHGWAFFTGAPGGWAMGSGFQGGFFAGVCGTGAEVVYLTTGVFSGWTIDGFDLGVVDPGTATGVHCYDRFVQYFDGSGTLLLQVAIPDNAAHLTLTKVSVTHTPVFAREIRIWWANQLPNVAGNEPRIEYAQWHDSGGLGPPSAAACTH